MLRLVCSFFVALVLAPGAMAQEERFEVFAGLSHLEAGGDPGRPGQFQPMVEPMESSQNGWVGSLAWSVTRYFGVEGEVSGQYGGDNTFDYQVRSEVPGPPFVDVRVAANYKTHTLLAGPRVSASVGRVKPFARALVGAAFLRNRQYYGAVALFSCEEGGDCVGPSLTSLSSRSFAVQAGGGVDVEITDRVAWRAVQADYLRTSFADRDQDGVKVATGFVFRF